MRTFTTLLHFTSAVVLATVLAGCPDSGPAPAPKAEPAAPAAPKAPLIPKTQVADWCRDHGVPESVCTRCNTALVADFQKKGDWCKDHSLPESQCVACHPELKAKFEAMAPKTEGAK